MRMEVGKEEYTVVGTMPDLALGEFIAVSGTYVTHPTFGRQLKAQLIERKMPEGLNEIFRYLSAGTIAGIGKATAKNLINAFGEDVLEVIEKDHAQLITVKGITQKRASAIHDSFCKQMGTRRLLTFLALHNLPTTLAPPLSSTFGDMALTLIEANPYLLTEEGFGLDFARADQLALSLGVSPDDFDRLKAGLLFELRHNLGNGHTFLPREKLINATAVLLACKDDDVMAVLDDLETHGEVMCEEISKQDAVYLPPLFDAENYVADRMCEMAQAELLPPKNLNKLIDKIQTEQQISYSTEQKNAVKLASQHQVMLLTGGPGTGKTTSLRGVLALFDHLELETSLAAPTGRAAQRLGDLCGGEASTIHRLLDTGVDPQSGRMVFLRDQDNPIRAEAVIVDETSMVDISLMAALLSALPNGCRLVLVGDPDQLPSVGPGNVFSDLITSEQIPMVRLDEIFRQAQESSIIRNAHAVNRGEQPDLSQKSGDFFFLSTPSAQETLDTIVDLCRRRLPERMGIPSDQIQVLSPTRRRATGTVALNKALQEALNPPHKSKGERTYGDWIFRAGDRVMQVKNNYDIVWECGKNNGMGVFNGDIGMITKVEDGCVVVSFEGKVVEYTPDMLSELEPAFAITVHKAQGSEYKAVVLACLDGAPMLLTRGVLYTGITRARSLFIGVGAPHVVHQMTQNHKQTKRYSGLKARLLSP